jgi:peptidoglycan/xylan/chitin deacetylase (PgdA/CDA1 family)
MRIAAAAFALVLLGGLAAFGAFIVEKHGRQQMAAPASASTVGTGTAALPAAAPSPTAAPVVATAPEAPVATTVPATEAAPAPAAIMAQAQATAAAPASPPAAAAATPSASSCAGNPDALGVSRVVEVDTTGGPGFGFEHFRQHDFLRTGEVVLTFDDGPWLKNTPAVLAALAAHCTKAIFFPIGKHATYYPEILKQVAAAGHSVGSHTWSHADLAALMTKKGGGIEAAKEEIEKGISAVHWAVGGPTAPFFRFPALRHPPELISYLGERGIGIFSTDMDSFDFKMRKPDQVVQAVMTKLKKFGKGIVLMHDFQHATAEGASDLLRQLKANGYKVVFMKAKAPVTTIAQYDELIMKDQKLPTASDRPTTSVIRTISE